MTMRRWSRVCALALAVVMTAAACTSDSNAPDDIQTIVQLEEHEEFDLEPVWAHSIGVGEPTVVVDDDSVFTVMMDTPRFAQDRSVLPVAKRFDMESGEEVWSTDVDLPDGYDYLQSAHDFPEGAAPDGRGGLVVGLGGEITRIDPGGGIQWRTELPGDPDSPWHEPRIDGLAVDGDAVYVRSNRAVVTAFGLDDGDLRWTLADLVDEEDFPYVRSDDDWGRQRFLGADDGYVVVHGLVFGSFDAVVVIRDDGEDPEMVWTRSLPVHAFDLVDGQLLTVDATVVERWDLETGESAGAVEHHVEVSDEWRLGAAVHGDGYLVWAWGIVALVAVDGSDASWDVALEDFGEFIIGSGAIAGTGSVELDGGLLIMHRDSGLGVIGPAGDLESYTVDSFESPHMRSPTTYSVHVAGQRAVVVALLPTKSRFQTVVTALDLREMQR